MLVLIRAQDDAARALDERVRALKEDAELKNLVNSTFVHAGIRVVGKGQPPAAITCQHGLSEPMRQTVSPTKDRSASRVISASLVI